MSSGHFISLVKLACLKSVILHRHLESMCICRIPSTSPACHHFIGLVVKASAWRAEDPGFESRLRPDFSRSSHTSDLKIGTPVATLPGAWRYGVSAGTGWPGVSIL